MSEANANPCTSPKPLAMNTSPWATSGRMAWTAETAIDNAMSVSTGRDGRWITPRPPAPG